MSGIVVTAYRDAARGVMAVEKKGAGRFTSVTLSPMVTIEAGGDMDKAQALHHKANDMCFIANSMNFPIQHEATIKIS